jgi:hypothetical protein
MRRASRGRLRLAGGEGRAREGGTVVSLPQYGVPSLLFRCAAECTPGEVLQTAQSWMDCEPCHFVLQP